jgi:hypothetical protein
MNVSELERRVARAYTATWRSDLRFLTRDLPFELPIDRRRVVSGVDRFQRALLRFHAWCYASFNTVLIAMWGWGGGGDFWPALSIVPGGALLLWHNKGSKAASRRLARPREERQRALAA